MLRAETKAVDTQNRLLRKWEKGLSPNVRPTKSHLLQRMARDRLRALARKNVVFRHTRSKPAKHLASFQPEPSVIESELGIGVQSEVVASQPAKEFWVAGKDDMVLRLQNRDFVKTSFESEDEEDSAKIRQDQPIRARYFSNLSSPRCFSEKSQRQKVEMPMGRAAFRIPPRLKKLNR